MSNPKCNNPFNRYATKMAEIGLQRNPMAQEVILVLNDQVRDHYQDAVSEENNRIKKWAKVTKDPQMHYVQFEDTDELFEDTGNPWIISMTVEGIKEYVVDPETGARSLSFRIPRTDDQILVDGVLYTISLVEPVNRFVDGLINCTVYPERSSQDDPLTIYSVTEHKTGVYSIVWGGNPVEYSLDDGTTWLPFASYFKATDPSTVSIKDAEGIIAEWRKQV